MRRDHRWKPTWVGGIVAMLMMAAFWATSAQAQVGTGVIRVAPTGTDVAGCGSASQPCRTPYHATLQSIRNSAFQGEIRLAGGTYSSSPTEELIKITTVSSYLRIIGGFSTSDWENSNPAVNPTILDGTNSKRGLLISVTDGIAPTCNVTIAGLTIQNGRAPATDPYGGGITIDNCMNVRIGNVTIKDSRAIGQNNTNAGSTSPGAGGAIALRGNTTTKAGLILNDVTLQDNQANGGTESTGARGGLGTGGGLFVINSTLTATNLIVTGNSVKGGDAPGRPGNTGIQLADGLGGGIAIIDSPSFNIAGLTVTQNSATGGNAGTLAGLALGGGLFIERSTGTISGATIQANQVIGATSSSGGGTGGAGLGGGIFVTDSTLVVQQSELLANTATGGNATGGASTGGNGGGGGLYATIGGSSPNNLTLTNVVIAGHTSIAGNGTQNDPNPNGGALTLDQTIFSLNHLTLADNTLSGSAPSIGQAILLAGNQTTGSLRYSIISGHADVSPIYPASGVGQLTLDRILTNGNAAPLVDPTNGTPVTQTNITSGAPDYLSPGSPDYNYRIGSGSAAIGQAAGSPIMLDLDGQHRPVGGASDVGADEYQIALSAIGAQTAIALDWDPAPGATVTRYEVEYIKEAGASDAAEGASPIDAGTATAFDLTGLTTGKLYTITIVAYNGASEVARSAPVAVRAGFFPISLPMIVY